MPIASKNGGNTALAGVAVKPIVCNLAPNG